jgi:uncharacterized protein (DUF697 family)
MHTHSMHLEFGLGRYPGIQTLLSSKGRVADRHTLTHGIAIINSDLTYRYVCRLCHYGYGSHPSADQLGSAVLKRQRSLSVSDSHVECSAFIKAAGDRSPELYRIAGHSAVCGAELGALAGLLTSLGPPDRGLIYNSSDMDKTKLEAIKKDMEALGGVSSLNSGDWLLKLVQKSFSAYYSNATPEFFRAKYPGLGADAIFKKLRKSAVRQSGLAGAGCGALMSVNEIMALVTVGEGGLGIPANIAAALATVAGELLVVTKIQLEMVSRIARLYGVELDPNDSEDVWVILAVAIGGQIAQETGKLGITVGGRVAQQAVKGYVKGETLAYIKKLAAKLGFKLLQRTIATAAVPVVSIPSAAIYNRVLTGRIADAARKHFQTVARERLAGIADEEASAADSPHIGV